MMSRSVNTVHKKKSFIERIFNFASQTMKLNKKSSTTNHKKKLKSNMDRTTVINPSLIMYTEPIETCTFCDYCDGEILAKYTGQNIIYHDACKPGSLNSIQLDMGSPPYGPVTSLKDATQQLTESMSSVRTGRDDDDDGDSRFYTARCSLSATDLHLFGTGLDTMVTRADDPGEASAVGTGQEAYTFSTVDMTTVRQYGISIRKIPSVSQPPPSLIEGMDTELTAGQREVLVTKPVDDAFDQLPLPYELDGLIDTFNNNDQGLLIERLPTGQVHGKVRVFVNLIRPIKMLLTARPPSIFDMLSDVDRDKPTLQRAYYNKEVIFWLPRGSTNLLYTDLHCTTSELITMLLTKFNIQNNPKKFALYEHTIISPTEIESRKFRPHHCPLRIMLQWCLPGPENYRFQLKRKRFVLQENDPGSIDWDEFSIPELNSFLKIITQEEQEKRNTVIRRYSILRSEIIRCMRVDTDSASPCI